MSQLTTDCPNCSTKFHLAPEQIEAARGLVRCGKCMTVFSASDLRNAEQQQSSEQPEDSAKLPVMTELLHSEFNQQQVVTKDQKPSRIFAKLIVILVGTALLAAQYSYFFSRELSQTATYRQPLIDFCHFTGCTIDLFRDVDRLAVRQFSVYSDPSQQPSQNGVLTVDLIIENLGLFDQPYPKIALRFADMDDQLVAERIFLAPHYLSRDPQSLSAETKQIPRGKQRRINFRLVDPGAKATNYSVELKE